MKPLDCMPLYEDAWLYDQEFRDREHELPFYKRHSQSTKGEVLEIACGTGRITLPIAAGGVTIAGVDASGPMIALARQKAIEAQLTVDWYEQDARSMNLGRRFGLAFIATNALQHLHDLDSLRAFFSRVREHLDVDGRLIIDVFNPSIAKLARTPGAPYPHKTFTLLDGRKVDVDADSEYLADAQLFHFVLTYRHDRQVIRTKDVFMRCFFPEELLLLCRLGGFDVVQRFGDYDEAPFTKNAPKQIVLCRRSAGAASG
jgi:SAM-dependent methyltransferase